MAYISENGIVRKMTEEEEKELFTEPCEVFENPLKKMAQAMSNATSLAQMRAAAKAFLAATEAEYNEIQVNQENI